MSPLDSLKNRWTTLWSNLRSRITGGFAVALIVTFLVGLGTCLVLS